LILIGALLMVISIIKSRAVFRLLSREAAEESEKVKWFFRVHEVLMLFFLLGYVAVAYAIVMNVHVASELFVGLIFFFGAVFVLTGIMLKSIMVSTMKRRYDQAVSARNQLQEGKKRLETTNLNLIQEIDDRRQAEKALQQSGAFLQNLIDVFPEQIMVINRDYTIALANAQARLNVPPAENIIGQHCHAVSHGSATPCGGDGHPCPLKEIIKQKRPVTMEHLHQDAHGDDMFVEIVAAPLYDGDGQVTQIIEVCHDITERKRSAQKIVESERKYRSILESIEEGYFEIDLKGSLTFFNPSMCDILGYPPEELHGMNYREYTSPETAGVAKQIFRKTLETQESTIVTGHEIIARDGEAKAVEVSAAVIKDNNGRPAGFRGVVRDVSKITRARQALQDSEERYKKLSQVTIEGICFHDHGEILDANDSFLNMFGYTLAELAGKNSIDFLITPEDQPIVHKNASTGFARPYEVMARRKDGSLFPVEIEGRNTRYLDKSVRVAAFRDITERRRTEEKLSQVQKMEAIGTLAGGIAHDFNNILSAIMGYTEILKLQADAAGPTSEKLNRILQASHRARELVHQILAFSRQQEEELQPVQIGLIAREALKLLRASIPATIEFETAISRETGAVLADPTRIHQVLMNLCTNASHAMLDKGGTLTVSLNAVSLDDDSAAKIPDLESGAYVQLVVADTGHGMEPSVQQRIFEPYFTTKEQGIGTGLGLAAVHGIVKRTGGAIEVFSTPGAGSTFKLYFPMIAADTLEEPAQQAALQYGNETILLVDDDEIVIEMTRDMLAAFGYEVDLRMSSIDALKVFRHHPDRYDLVLTDQTMPQLAGDGLVEKIREIRPDIPVILCTGFSDTLSPGKMKRLGINGFLMKPIVMRDLADTIRAALDQERAADPFEDSTLN
jgi:PAS domain S-box-containing protein